MEFRYVSAGDDFSIAGAASTDIKKKLKQLGIAGDVIRRTAISMYEAEMNMVLHAGGGETIVTISPEEIEIILIDQGPGIPDIDQAMEEGFSTATSKVREIGFGAGMGLSNMKKNSDELKIKSEVGKGTTVTIRLIIKQ